MTDFDLARCMKDGGRCLICHVDDGRLFARGSVGLTDFLRGGKNMLLVRYLEEGEIDERTLVCQQDGSELGGPYVLRNLPEYKEVEVTLWVNDKAESWFRVEADPNAMQESGWQPYGPPVKVRFER